MISLRVLVDWNVLSFDDDIKVIQSSLIPHLKIASNTQRYELRRSNGYLLINIRRIENVPYFDYAVLKICNQIGTGNFDLENEGAPLNLSEVEVIDTIQIHVERLIIAGHYEGFEKFVENRTWKIFIGFLLELVIQYHLALVDEGFSRS